jgi:hypothetical protein
MIRFCAALTFFLIVMTGCGEKPQPAKVSVPVKKELSKPLNLPKMYEFSRKSTTPYEDGYVVINGNQYVATYKGKIVRNDSTTKALVPVLDIRAEFMVDRLFIYPLNQQHYVVWQETDHLGVNTYFALYDNGAVQPEWKIKYHGPNPGPPVVDSVYAYVTALGLVGKMNMLEGTYVWKADSLYEPIKKRFHKFDQPLVYENEVHFVDLPIRGRKERRDTIKLNRFTGARLR